MVALKEAASPYFGFNQDIQRRNRNQLLAMMMSPADAKAADGGGFPQPDAWTMAFVSTGFGNRAISKAEFRSGRDEIIGGIEKSMGSKLSDRISSTTNDALAALLKERGVSGSGATLGIGSIMPLGLYAREDDHIVYGAVSRVKIGAAGKEEEIPLVMVLAIVSTRDRVLNLACYRVLKSRADIDAVKSQMAAWVRAVIAANR
jgi:hypothetical protein